LLQPEVMMELPRIARRTVVVTLLGLLLAVLAGGCRYGHYEGVWRQGPKPRRIPFCERGGEPGDQGHMMLAVAHVFARSPLGLHGINTATGAVHSGYGRRHGVTMGWTAVVSSSGNALLYPSIGSPEHTGEALRLVHRYGDSLARHIGNYSCRPIELLENDLALRGYPLRHSVAR
jgi:hypothetical protein